MSSAPAQVTLGPSAARTRAISGLAGKPTEELLGLAREGDRPAFDEIYRRYYPAVVRRLTHLAGPGVAAHDLAQETFVQAYRSLPQLRQDTGFGGWVLRIATNVARAHHRQRRHRFWQLWLRPEEETAVAAPAPTVDESYPTLLAVHHALARLSPTLREAVVLFELEGLSLAELATTLEVPLHTAASRVRRGRDGLRRALERLGCRPGAVVDGVVVLCGSDPR